MAHNAIGIDLVHALREWLITHAELSVERAQKVAERFSAYNMEVDWIELTNEKGEWKIFKAQKGALTRLQEDL